MKLSGEMFQEIISQLVSDNAPDNSDKRKEPRVGIRAQGFVSPWSLDVSGERQTRVTIRDLSPAGICILNATSIPKGTRFILQMPRMYKGGMLLAHYECRYCKPLSGNLFCVGAKLVNLEEMTVSGAA